VVVTTLGLFAVISAGCYSDLLKLAAGDKKKQIPTAGSRRTTKTAAGG
jgi:hypothetical protein